MPSGWVHKVARADQVHARHTPGDSSPPCPIHEIKGSCGFLDVLLEKQVPADFISNRQVKRLEFHADMR